MTTLVFENKGWTVATSAWSAASKTKGTSTLCYAWGQLTGGVAQIELPIDVETLLSIIARGAPLVDLRSEIAARGS